MRKFLEIVPDSQLAFIVAVGLWVAMLPAPALAQWSFGRVANQPWSGQVVVVNHRQAQPPDRIRAAIQNTSVLERVPVSGIDKARLQSTTAPNAGQRLEATSRVSALNTRVLATQAMTPRASTPDTLTENARVSAIRPDVARSVVLASGKLNAPKPPPAPPPPSAPKSMTINLAPILLARWEAARGDLKARGEAFLHERDIGGGFRTSKNHLDFSAGGPMFVGTDGRGFTVRFQLPGNTLSTYLRTPTPLPEGTDPGFLVTFDLDVQVDIDANGRQFTAGPARIKANVHRPEGKNITGDLAIATNDLVSALSGQDFIGQILAVVNGNEYAFDTGINEALGPVNAMLQTTPADTGIHPDYDAAAASVIVNLVKVGPGPVVK